MRANLPATPPAASATRWLNPPFLCPGKFLLAKVPAGERLLSCGDALQPDGLKLCRGHRQRWDGSLPSHCPQCHHPGPVHPGTSPTGQSCLWHRWHPSTLRGQRERREPCVARRTLCRRAGHRSSLRRNFCQAKCPMFHKETPKGNLNPHRSDAAGTAEPESPLPSGLCSAPSLVPRLRSALGLFFLHRGIWKVGFLF